MIGALIGDISGQALEIIGKSPELYSILTGFERFYSVPVAE